MYTVKLTLEHTGLNSAGPCTCRHFKIVNSVEFTTDYNQPLYDAWLVEPLRMVYYRYQGTA